MTDDTRYGGLRFLAGVHNVIGGVALGLTILVGGGFILAGVLGVGLLGATGETFYRDSRALIAGGIVVMLIGGPTVTVILGLGQVFRAVADIADNSYTALFVLARRPGDAIGASKADAGDAEEGPPGPMAL